MQSGSHLMVLKMLIKLLSSWYKIFLNRVDKHLPFKEKTSKKSQANEPTWLDKWYKSTKMSQQDHFKDIVAEKNVRIARNKTVDMIEKP